LWQRYRHNLTSGGKRKMNRNNSIFTTIVKYGIIIALVTGIVLLVSMSQFFFPREEEILAPPLRKPEEVSYTTYEVKKGSIINIITCRGYFTPEKQVDVSFKTRDGYLGALYVTSGERVRKGDLLAVLDTDTLENEIKRQKLVLERACDVHNKLQKIAGIDISISKMKLEALRKELDLKYQLKENVPQGEIEKQEQDVALGEYAHEKVVLDYEYQLSAAESDITMARLRLEELELELEKSTMRAPISGIADYVAFINVGEYISSYKTLVRIAEPDRLVLRYKGSQYEHFRLGMRVTVSVDKKKYKGSVILTPFEVPPDDFEKMKETIMVRVLSLPGSVKIDDVGILEATLERADDVIVLPKKFVHTYVNRVFVKILDNGIVRERDVELGIESGTEYEITGGLAVGELIVE
jgi:membrane fusion protein, macrolide-specific efflux system